MTSSSLAHSILSRCFSSSRSVMPVLYTPDVLFDGVFFRVALCPMAFFLLAFYPVAFFPWRFVRILLSVSFSYFRFRHLQSADVEISAASSPRPDRSAHPTGYARYIKTTPRSDLQRATDGECIRQLCGYDLSASASSNRYASRFDAHHDLALFTRI